MMELPTSRRFSDIRLEDIASMALEWKDKSILCRMWIVHRIVWHGMEQQKDMIGKSGDQGGFTGVPISMLYTFALGLEMGMKM